MNVRNLVLTAVLVTAVAGWSQSQPAQTPPQGAQQQSGAGMQKPMGSGMAKGQMKGMQAQHMQEMKESLAKMRTLLDQMKANAAGMSGKDKAAMEDNVQLWEMMLQHMEQMQQHMSAMQGRMMHQGGKRQMRPMAPQKPGTPPPPPPPPPQTDNPATPPQR